MQKQMSKDIDKYVGKSKQIVAVSNVYFMYIWSRMEKYELYLKPDNSI